MRAPTANGKPKRTWAQRLRRWGLEAAIVLVVLVLVQGYKARTLAEGMAPALRGRAVASNQQIDLARPASGPRLIHFWATWCPVCKLEEGSIEALGKDYEVMTVAMQSGDRDEISRYLDERALNLRVIADPTGEIARQWGVQAVPASFIVGSDGRIRFRRVGYITGLELRVRLWLAKTGAGLSW